ncbi:MAG TPA: potassium channel family protein [Solirubrobacteraceae bacterium]|nr:potassium channel family protein [Solirubrobacteraceae bacterium]
MRLHGTTAAAVDERMCIPLTIAALMVIPDLILEEQPLTHTWHTVAVLGNWAIWLAFLVEFVAILALAKDWRAWMHQFPLALPMIVLTPPFAPAAIQGLRAFRLLRLLRVARGFQFLSKGLLSLEGVRYVAALAVFLVLGGGVALAQVETTAAKSVSDWDGIWWAIGFVTTNGEGSHVHTNAGRAIAIVLMLTGIGVFAVLTAAVAQRFVASREEPQAAAEAARISEGEQAIMARLDEISTRLREVEPALGTAPRR